MFFTLKKIAAAYVAVALLLLTETVPALAAAKEGQWPANLLHGWTASAPDVFVALGNGLRLRSSRLTKTNRDAGMAILRISASAVKRKASLPVGVTGDQQCFRALTKMTGNAYYLVDESLVKNMDKALEKESESDIQSFPNIIKYLEENLPGDTHFSNQWCHENKDNPYADMDSPKAWDITTGSTDVVVALIDSGADYIHPDLAANIWTNPWEIAGNGIDDDNNGYIDDIHGIDTGDGDSEPLDYDGHGTHVAGIMGALGDNDLGVAGVNWRVKIMVLKGFEESSDGMSTSMEVEAIDYILAMKAAGVNIVAVNASYGFTGSEDEVEKEAIEALGEAGILFMAAAGNDADNNDTSYYGHYPSSYDLDNIVSVAAGDADGQLAWFSNYGEIGVDLAAPGEEILSTVMSDYVYTPVAGDLFYDDMESGDGNWTPEGTWAITEEQADSPSHAWSDSPDGRYTTYSDLALTGPVLDISQASTALALGFSIRHELEEAGANGYFDSLQVWYLSPPETDDADPEWEKIGVLAGSSEEKWVSYSAVIPKRFFWDGFRFRFVLHSDYSIQKDGVYIDDVGVGVPETIYPYAYYSGTSMATPQVTGTAGLVAAAFPDFGAMDIKNRLLNGTLPMADLEGAVATGGTLNLAGALGNPTEDSDADGVPDFRDNCAATANADQTDTDIDGYGNACDCDLNNDDQVDISDFMQFRDHWRSSEAMADFNGDGVVDVTDYMIFRDRWRTSAPFE